MKTNKNAGSYFIEVEKANNWNEGYLTIDGKVTEDFEDAAYFSHKRDAEEEADLFNIEYGRGGRIYARVV